MQLFFVPKNFTECYNNQTMKFLTTSLGYLKWHYGKALATTFSFWKNILVFLFDFFSIKSLLGNFLTPWKRLADSYPKKLDLKVYFFTFLANTIMRIVGMILRLIVITIGLVCCTLFVFCLPLTLLIWLVLPIIVICLIIFGLYFIIIPNYKI